MIEFDRLRAEFRDFQRGQHGRPGGYEPAFVDMWDKVKPYVEGRALPRWPLIECVLMAFLLARELEVRDLRAEAADARRELEETLALLRDVGSAPAGSPRLPASNARLKQSSTPRG